jgi:ubiquinone/menaquinone biosynthesis C-methylase UbiE
VRSHYDSAEMLARYRSDGELTSAERALVEKHVPAHSSFLEVGTGAGRAALELARLGHRVTAMDISPGMVELARETATRLGLDVRFDVGDAVDLEYADDSFDASAFFCNGIGHLPRPDMARCLGELHRVTRPGGAILIAYRTPYAVNRLLPGLLIRAATRRGERRDDVSVEGAYVHWPSRRTLERLMRAAGIELVESTSLRAAAARRSPRAWELVVGGQFFLVGRSR